MEFLALGFGLGLAAGIAPGPLHMLVLTTSLQRGFVSGVRVAIAPLLTDLPIVTAGVLAAGTLPDGVVRTMAVAGGLFVIYLGVDTLRWSPDDSSDDEASAARDIGRGFFTNLLSPHPWLFWLGAGGPLLNSAWDESRLGAVGFLGAFYLLLIGSKVALALIAARGTRFVETPWYGWLVRGSGLLLAAMGVWLVQAALRGTI